MDAIRQTYIMCFIGLGAMTYFVINQNNIIGSKVPKNNRAQVSFRDPAAIAEHQKVLDELNRKKKLESKSK
jgi:hypothetical protein